MALRVSTVETKPIEGMALGTSGLRKLTKEFLQPNYTENFVQCVLTAMGGTNLQGTSYVVGGDGRYYVKEATELILRMCAANGVCKVLVGRNGLMSTPAVSCVIRKYKTNGGIILTASHNPGGIDNDFGIKFNMENGGPAPAGDTDRAFELSKTITKYKICKDLEIDISKLGTQKYYVNGVGEFTVEILDSVSDYMAMCKEIFDFTVIKNHIRGLGKTKCQVLANGLSGVTGPYIKRIFVDELGVNAKDAIECEPLPDFGGGHPDPNLTYGAALVDALKKGEHDFGVAFDGDGDRNMVLGKNAFFVSPCDSLAVIADNIEVIPYFKKNGVKGFARSMPTSGALDRVAKAKGKELFVTPTGWKFFGNLMDAGRMSLCGEESFGTGSDHIREKDGMWAALAWLSILAARKQGVEDIVKEHWSKYGRNFFTRYDYENCDSAAGKKVVDLLDKFIATKANIGKLFGKGEKKFKVAKAEDFEYHDPIDKSVSKKQGIMITFDDGSRIVFRLSGTGSSGATIRMYIDSYESDKAKIFLSSEEMLKPLIEIALEISQLRELTGRSEPNVIT